MTTDVEHAHLPETSSSDRVYSPDILPLLQSLLAKLADVDFAYEKNLEAIRRSPGDEELKRDMIDKVRRLHQERRAPYVQELAALQERVWASFS